MSISENFRRSTFDYIDFTPGRPGARLTDRPKSRPGRTPLWHMGEVKNNEGIIVRFVGSDSDAVPTSVAGRHDLGIVGAHDKLVTGR